MNNFSVECPNCREHENPMVSLKLLLEEKEKNLILLEKIKDFDEYLVVIEMKKKAEEILELFLSSKEYYVYTFEGCFFKPSEDCIKIFKNLRLEI